MSFQILGPAYIDKSAKSITTPMKYLKAPTLPSLIVGGSIAEFLFFSSHFNLLAPRIY